MRGCVESRNSSPVVGCVKYLRIVFASVNAKINMPQLKNTNCTTNLTTLDLKRDGRRRNIVFRLISKRNRLRFTAATDERCRLMSSSNGGCDES